jgi:hypothetical protein
VDGFPEDVRRFIVDHITSVDQLEVLLLVRGQPRTDWGAVEVSRKLYTQPEAASLRLESLHALGFVERAGDSDPVSRYHPRTPELDQLASRLEEVYKERRVAVIALIYSKPDDPARAFADAFRFRKGK